MRRIEPTLPLLIDVLAFAADKHRKQRRKDKERTPYINHPIALMQELAQAGIDDIAVLSAALLHDTVEDTDTTFEELEARFGHDIAALVAEVSDDKSLPKQQRKRLQIVHAAQASHRAKLIKLADKICNLRDLRDNPPARWSHQRIYEYCDWANQVLIELAGTHTTLEGRYAALLNERRRTLERKEAEMFGVRAVGTVDDSQHARNSEAMSDDDSQARQQAANDTKLDVGLIELVSTLPVQSYEDHKAEQDAYYAKHPEQLARWITPM